MKSSALLAGPWALPKPLEHERIVQPTAIGPLDAIIGGLPCGAISEIHGRPSSGRTTLLYSALAAATSKGDHCAIVDAADSFDPVSAAEAGVNLRRIVWIRCGANAEHAMKAADLLVQGGGFRILVLDLADIAPRALSRIPLSYWYRFRRAVDSTPTAMVVVSAEPQVRQCASLTLEMAMNGVDWLGHARGTPLLAGARLEAVPRKPVRPHTARFKAEALG